MPKTDVPAHRAGYGEHEELLEVEQIKFLEFLAPHKSDERH